MGPVTRPDVIGGWTQILVLLLDRFGLGTLPGSAFGDQKRTPDLRNGKLESPPANRTQSERVEERTCFLVQVPFLV